MYAVYRNMNENELKVSADDEEGLVSIYGEKIEIEAEKTCDKIRSVVQNTDTGDYWILTENRQISVKAKNGLSRSFNFTYDSNTEADAIFYAGDNKLGLITSSEKDDFKILWNFNVKDVNLPSLEKPRFLDVPVMKKKTKPDKISLAIISRSNPEHVYLLNYHKHPKVFKYNFVKNKFLNFSKYRNRKSVLSKRTRFESVFAKIVGDRESKMKLREVQGLSSVFFDETGKMVILTESNDFSFESSTLKIASTEDFQHQQLNC